MRNRYTTAMSDAHDAPTPIDHPTVVLGAGLAGLAAAVALAQRGVAVTLLAAEDAPEHPHTLLPRAAQSVDDLLARLHADSPVRYQDALAFAFLADGGEPAVDQFKADDLPAPMHLVRPLSRCQGWSVSQKFAIARGLLAIVQVSRRSQTLYHDQTFGSFLTEHNQPASAIDTFWSPLTVALAGRGVDHLRADSGIQMFQDALLLRSEAFAFGVPALDTAALLAAAEPIITAAGGRVVTHTTAEALVSDGSKVTAVRMADGQEIAGRAFITAVPCDRLASLAAGSLKDTDDRLGGLADAIVRTSIGVELFVKPADSEARALEHPAVLTPGARLAWLSCLGINSEGEHAGSQRLAGALHAESLERASDDEVLTAAMSDARRLVPGFDDAVLVQGSVTRLSQVMFPADAPRPTTRGSVENLMLAGGWLDTGWPGTPEGAVRSGYAAATAVLREAGADAADQSVPEPEPGQLAAFVAG